MAKKVKATITEPEPFSFGLKISFKDKKITDPKEVKLQCTDGGHNKFYNIYIHSKQRNQHIVSFHYGKIGTSGTTLNHSFKDENKAIEFLNKKKFQKINKGYKIVG